MKHCKSCNVTKEPSEFYLVSGKYLYTYCKQCARGKTKEWTLKNKDYVKSKKGEWEKKNPERARQIALRGILKFSYNMTLEQYDSLLTKQDFVCAICHKINNIQGRRLEVDHDHKTGKIRGLLCNGCNVGIGAFSDDMDLMAKAVQYVNKYI